MSASAPDCRPGVVDLRSNGSVSAAAAERQRIACSESEVDLAGHQVLRSWSAATVGHDGKLRPGFFLKERG
jgi:hypothetical protein